MVRERKTGIGSVAKQQAPLWATVLTAVVLVYTEMHGVTDSAKARAKDEVGDVKTTAKSVDTSLLIAVAQTQAAVDLLAQRVGALEVRARAPGGPGQEIPPQPDADAGSDADAGPAPEPAPTPPPEPPKQTPDGKFQWTPLPESPWGK